VLLVIFGAGASYDSVPHFFPPAPHLSQELDRLPLANQLFDNRPIFLSAMQKFEDCMALVPLLRKPGVLVERELARFQEQAQTFPRRYQQLAAIRYYLHFALWQCQRQWFERHKGITNYATLLDEIERWRFEFSEQVCFVTFNYDTMLEDAMSQVLRISIGDLDGYVLDAHYVLIKLHGSVNWGREVDGLAGPTGPDHFIPMGGIVNQQRLIDESPKLRITNRYRLVTNYPMLREGDRLVFPALAIPVEKKDEFSCPSTHVQALKERLPKVTKILTIGWRATEAEFLGLLQSKLEGKADLMVVSGDKAGAAETSGNLSRSAVQVHPHTFVENGFTNLILELGQLSVFLRGHSIPTAH
jgi:hypothetical protein